MSTRPPNRGRGELDEPREPAGAGAGSGTLDTNIPIAPPREPQPLSPPRVDQPIAGGWGVGPEGEERRVRQEDADRWEQDERRSETHRYEDNPEGGSTRH